MGGGTGQMAILNLALQLLQFIQGPFGITTIIIGTMTAFIGAAINAWGWNRGFVAIICGAFAWSSAYIINTWVAV
jgi:type IV secretory pathway VirB2 component (pilin)